MLLAPISNEKFRYEHLLSNPKNLEDIQSFVVEKKSGKGLERYIKMLAEPEEYERSNRTYLVRDKETNEIAAYFSLHTGSFTLKEESVINKKLSVFMIWKTSQRNYKKNLLY